MSDIIKARVHLWLLLALATAGALVTASATWMWIGSAPLEITARDVVTEDHTAARSYATGLRQLADSEFNQALVSFELARMGNTPILVSAANGASEHIRHILDLPRWFHGPALWLGQFSPATRWVAIIMGLALTLIFGRNWLERFPLRRGCDIGRVLVFMDGSEISESQVQMLLRDKLRHIGFRLQKPTGSIGGTIGPVLAVDTLLPVAEGNSPLGEVLSNIGQLAEKGAPWAIAQAQRAVTQLRPRRRFRLEGGVRGLQNGEAYSWATLTDLRSGQDLVQVSASSNEAALYVEDSSGREDGLTEAVQRALEVLALKVWQVLSEGTRPGMKPTSWLTLATLISALDAMSDVEGAAPDLQKAEYAHRSLRRILNEYDPLYMPARFLHGYTLLLRGELDACAKEMLTIRRETEEAAIAYATGLAERWYQYKVRGWLLAPILRFHTLLSKTKLGKRIAQPLQNVRDASEWFLQIGTKAEGGKFYRVAKAWAEFDDIVRRRKKILGDNSEATRAYEQAYLLSFKEYPEFQELVALELKNYSEGSERSKERKILDYMFDLDKIKTFDSKLKLLNLKIGIIPITASAGFNQTTDAELISEISSLKESRVGSMFEKAFDKAKLLVEEKQYKEADEFLSRIRDEVLYPSPFDAPISIVYILKKAVESELVKFIFPVLSKVEIQRRIILDDRFYLESCYYYFLALYQTFQLSNLKATSEIDTDTMLQTYFVTKNYSIDSPAGEIVSLIKCLQVAVYARLQLAEPLFVLSDDRIHPVIFQRTQDPSYEGVKDELEKARARSLVSSFGLLDQLESWRRRGTPRLRASAAASLAHLARVRQEEDDEKKRSFIPSPDASDPNLLLREALALEPSALRHIELAELLGQKKQKDEAMCLLRIAQHLSPRHPVVGRWLTMDF
jgi:hypothetical protein